MTAATVLEAQHALRCIEYPDQEEFVPSFVSAELKERFPEAYAASLRAAARVITRNKSTMIRNKLFDLLAISSTGA